MRQFSTGATRDSEDGKYDYEGFLSPLVIEAYGRYMHTHRKQADGALRPSDNWQKGIPQDVYIKSLWRHFLDLWKLHRGYKVDSTVEEICGAVMFNVMGYLHEYLIGRRRNNVTVDATAAKSLDSGFVARKGSSDAGSATPGEASDRGLYSNREDRIGSEYGSGTKDQGRGVSGSRFMVGAGSSTPRTAAESGPTPGVVYAHTGYNSRTVESDREHLRKQLRGFKQVVPAYDGPEAA